MERTRLTAATLASRGLGRGCRSSQRVGGETCEACLLLGGWLHREEKRGEGGMPICSRGGGWNGLDSGVLWIWGS